MQTVKIPQQNPKQTEASSVDPKAALKSKTSIPPSISLGQEKPIRSKTPKRLRTGIKFDPVNPRDYLKYDFPTSCEDCTHFDSTNQRCTLGYESSWHRREFQKKSYELSGKMALCRFLEID